MQTAAIKPDQNSYSVSSPYKLFSKVGLNFSQDEEAQSTEVRENQCPLRGKRISAHNIFPLNADDTIKEDGFYIR